MRRSIARPPAPRRRLVAVLLGFVAVDLALALLVLGGVFDGSYAVAASQPRAVGALDSLGNDRWNGFPSDPEGPCAGIAYEIRRGNDVIGCTHGPDPIPAALKAEGAVDEDDLRARAEAIGFEGGGIAGGASGDVPCVGNGASGLRTIAVYAYEAGTPNNYSTYAPMIRSWAAEVDEIFDASAAQTSGSRHVRWNHDSACNVIVQQVALSTGAVYGDFYDPFTEMIIEMVNGGRDRHDRRYLVWVDASLNNTGICGIAMTYGDESAGAGNIHNGIPLADIPSFGRVDRECWGAPTETLVEAHELTHTFGAVQPHSPHSSSVVNDDAVQFYGHCTDEWDIMCYDDGTPKPLSFPCPIAQDRRLDCNHDDYFHTNPASSSYLGRNWNPAMNAFLVRNDPVAGFIDIADSAFYRADVAWVADQDITNGCSADLERYCPNDAVTREQMAAFLDRALNLPTTGTDFFTDDETSFAEAAINRVAAAGITSGCSLANSYCPDGTVTREQMAAFLYRAFRD